MVIKIYGKTNKNKIKIKILKMNDILGFKKYEKSIILKNEKLYDIKLNKRI